MRLGPRVSHHGDSDSTVAPGEDPQCSLETRLSQCSAGAAAFAKHLGYIRQQIASIPAAFSHYEFGLLPENVSPKPQINLIVLCACHISCSTKTYDFVLLPIMVKVGPTDPEQVVLGLDSLVAEWHMLLSQNSQF